MERRRFHTSEMYDAEEMVDKNLARIWFFQAKRKFDYGRFSASGLAQHQLQLCGPHDEAHIVEHYLIVVAVRNVTKLNPWDGCSFFRHIFLIHDSAISIPWALMPQNS